MSYGYFIGCGMSTAQPKRHPQDSDPNMKPKYQLSPMKHGVDWKSLNGPTPFLTMPCLSSLNTPPHFFVGIDCAFFFEPLAATCWCSRSEQHPPLNIGAMFKFASMIELKPKELQSGSCRGHVVKTTTLKACASMRQRSASTISEGSQPASWHFAAAAALRFCSWQLCSNDGLQAAAAS